MVKVYYIGAVENTQQLEKKLTKGVVFTNLLSDADCIIVEHKPQYLKFLEDLNTSKPYLYFVDKRRYVHLPLSSKYIFCHKARKKCLL